MGNYLNKDGLTYFWSKIKSYVSSVAATKAYVDDAIAAVASAGSGPKLKSILISPVTSSYVLPANTPKKVLLKTATYPDDRGTVGVYTIGTSSITIDGLTYNTGSTGYLPFDLVMTIETPTQTTFNRWGNAFMFEVE